MGRTVTAHGPQDEGVPDGTRVRRVIVDHVGGRGWLVGVTFVLGTILGSFANVLIHRLPRRESVIAPGSRCPSCRTPISSWDNIPVISYLILRGRCRHCGKSIGLRYFVVEVAAGALLAGLVWRYGVTLTAVRFAVLAIALLVAFFTDLETGLIPNAITYPGIVLGLILAAASGRGALISSLLTAVGAGGAFVLIELGWQTYQRISRRRTSAAASGDAPGTTALGGGDIKLAAMMGAFLGFPGVVVALFLGSAIGAVVGLTLIALRVRTRKDVIPFGPALATGAVITMFGQDAILRWYLSRLV